VVLRIQKKRREDKLFSPAFLVLEGQGPEMRRRGFRCLGCEVGRWAVLGRCGTMCRRVFEDLVKVYRHVVLFFALEQLSEDL